MYRNLQIVAQGVWDTLFNIYSCMFMTGYLKQNNVSNFFVLT